MRRKPEVRFRKTAASITAVAVLLFVSPFSESVTTAAYAAAEPVRVVNGEANPVPVVPGYNLFQKRIQIELAENAIAEVETFAVPQGKRLVLENITGVGGAGGINQAILSQAQGAFAVLPITALSGSGWRWMGTTPTKVIFDAGNVLIQIRRPAMGSSCGSCFTSTPTTRCLVSTS